MIVMQDGRFVADEEVAVMFAMQDGRFVADEEVAVMFAMQDAVSSPTGRWRSCSL